MYTFNCLFIFHRFLVRVSYLEIYNEDVRDLLSKDQSVRLEVSVYRRCFLSETWAHPFWCSGGRLPLLA
jgi:hypothetical protein